MTTYTLNDQLMTSLDCAFRTMRRRVTLGILADVSSSSPISAVRFEARGTNMDRKNLSQHKEQQAALQREMIIQELSAIALHRQEQGKSQTISQSKLGRYMDIYPDTLSDQLVKLERNGYLKRVRDKENRKEYHLTLTEKGEKRARELAAIKSQQNAEFLKPLNEEEKQTLLTLLGKLNIAEELGLN